MRIRRFISVLLLLLGLPVSASAAWNGNYRLDSTFIDTAGRQSTVLQNSFKGYLEDYYVNVETSWQGLGINKANLYLDRYINKGAKLFFRGYQLSSFSATDTDSVLQIGVDTSEYRLTVGKYIFNDPTRYSQPAVGLEAVYKPWDLTASLGYRTLGLRGRAKIGSDNIYNYALFVEGWSEENRSANITLDTTLQTAEDQKLQLNTVIDQGGGYGSGQWQWSPVAPIVDGIIKLTARTSLSGRDVVSVAKDRAISQLSLSYRRQLDKLAYYEQTAIIRMQLTNASGQSAEDQTDSRLISWKGLFNLPGWGEPYLALQLQSNQRSVTALTPMDQSTALGEVGWGSQILGAQTKLFYRHQQSQDTLNPANDSASGVFSYSLRTPVIIGFLGLNGYVENQFGNSSAGGTALYSNNLQYSLTLVENISGEIQYTNQLESAQTAEQSGNLSVRFHKLWGGYLLLTTGWEQSAANLTRSTAGFTYYYNFSDSSQSGGIRPDVGGKRSRLIVCVFEDTNNDGLYNNAERGFGSLSIRAKTITNKTGDNGRVELGIPMQEDQETIQVKLDETNLPFEYLMRKSALQDVQITAGEEVYLYYPVQEVKYLRGILFQDNNHNGVRDTGEAGLPNAVLMIDQERRVFTDANGAFRVIPIAPFAHQIKVIMDYYPEGAEITNLDGLSIEIAKNSPGIDNLEIGIYFPPLKKRQKSF